MKRNWNQKELDEHFSLLPSENHLVLSKKTSANRLGFAVLLKYFQQEAQFPNKKQDVPKDVVQYLADQLDASVEDFFDGYGWGGNARSYTDHRKAIRNLFGFRELTTNDNNLFAGWFKEQVHFTHDTDHLKNQAYSLFRTWKVEPPSIGSLKRMIESAINHFEQNLYKTTYQQLSPNTCSRLDAFLESHSDEGTNGFFETEITGEENNDILTFRQLLSSPGKPSVNTMEMEVKKLLAIQHFQIPNGLFKQMSPKLIKKYRLRAATETVTELNAHPEPIRYTLLAILFWHRHTEIIDSLADLLDEITHKLGNKATKTTRKEAIEELERVKGKNKHIINLLEAAVNHPDGVIQDTLFPIVDSDMIRDIIKDMTRNNRDYKEKIYMKMHSSYQGHYRKSLLKF